jgi:endonuclease-3
MPTRRPPSDAVKHRLMETLAQLYPTPATELNFTNEYELVSAVLLSAQCTDKKVNQVTPVLFHKYPTFGALSQAPIDSVQEIVRPINYYKTKANNLIEMAKKVVTEHQGNLPRTHAELITLPGVGNKTANVVLGELGITPTFPVDTHVFRLAHRLGLSRGKTPEDVEEDLKKQFNPAVWRALHHRFILHGRRVCSARSPQCIACSLAKICPSAE